METQSTVAGERITTFFDADELEQLARETKFVQRQPEVDGQIFDQTIILCSVEYPEASLAHWAQVCCCPLSSPNALIGDPMRYLPIVRPAGQLPEPFRIAES